MPKSLTNKERASINEASEDKNIGRFGRDRLFFLIENHPDTVRLKLENGTLWQDLQEANQKAARLLEKLMEEMWKKDPPKEGEKHQAVRNAHESMMMEIVREEILFPEGSSEVEEEE